MRLTIAICAHNESRSLPDVLASVLNQLLPHEQYEVLVVDNGSTDGSARVLASLAALHGDRLRHVVEPVRGLSHARNRALAEAKGEVVSFIDADALASRPWAAELLAAFDAEPAAGAVGGPVHILWDHPRPRWWDERLDEALNWFDLGEQPRTLEYPRYPYGTNLAVRREEAVRAGGFCTALGRHGRSLLAGEDGELCRRLEQRGWSVRYAPRALVHHRTAANRLTRRYILRRAFHHGRSQRVIEAMHEVAPGAYLSWRRIAWLGLAHAMTFKWDLPLAKFLAFRAGYHYERTFGRSQTRETASPHRVEAAPSDAALSLGAGAASATRQHQ